MKMSRFDMFILMIVNNKKAVEKLIKEYFCESRLKQADVLCLRTIMYHEEGLSASEICEISSYDKALVSRTLCKLKNGGYICRNDKDKVLSRGYRYVLTDKGRQSADKMSESIQKASERLADNIPQEDLEIFFRTAVRLSENIRNMPELVKKDPNRRYKKGNA